MIGMLYTLVETLLAIRWCSLSTDSDSKMSFRASRKKKPQKVQEAELKIRDDEIYRIRT
jgi:hypothetical protein